MMQPPPFGYLTAPQQFMPGMSWAQSNPSNQTPQSAQQYMMAQQLAMQNMMNQMYLQYMTQYANAFQNSNTDSNPMPSYPTTNFFNQPNFANVWNPTSANNNSNATTTDSQQPQPQAQQQAEQAPIVQPPRFQAGEEEENRDWLEILYTLSRLLVLSSLVYFYSSPGRCSIVIIVALLYYL